MERIMNDMDRQHLDSYAEKQQMVIDRVAGIINRSHSGLYLWGETGIGKTHNVEKALEEARERGLRSFCKLEGKCSPVGLYEMARDYPDSIIFVDDDPTLVKDLAAQQILLHLCGDGRYDPATRRNVRTVTNIKSRTRERCKFTGSVIITNNLRLANMPVLRALQGRIRTYHFNPTPSERAAKLRDLAETEDHAEVDQGERREICEFVISECEHSQQQLDFRLLKHAISDYRQWKRGEVKVHWRKLVVSSMQDHYTPAQAPTREEEKHQDQDRITDLIEEACRTGGSKESVIESWMAATRKRKTAFYDRRKELPEEWQRRYEALPDKRTAPPATEQAPAPEIIELREMIEDTEDLKTASRSAVIKMWTYATRRPEDEFPSVFSLLPPEWQARFHALPERPTAVGFKRKSE